MKNSLKNPLMPIIPKLEIPRLPWNAGLISRRLHYERLNDYKRLAEIHASVMKEYVEVAKLQAELENLKLKNKNLEHENELLRADVILKNKEVRKILEEDE